MIATAEENDMSDSAAIAVVRRFYDAKGDPAVSLVIDRALRG